jgi:hypothetical protein
MAAARPSTRAMQSLEVMGLILHGDATIAQPRGAGQYKVAVTRVRLDRDVGLD